MKLSVKLKVQAVPSVCPACGERMMVYSTHYNDGTWLIVFRCGHQTASSQVT